MPSSKLSLAKPKSLRVSIDLILLFSSLTDLRWAAALNITRFYAIKSKRCIRFSCMGYSGGNNRV